MQEEKVRLELWLLLPYDLAGPMYQHPHDRKAPAQRCTIPRRAGSVPLRRSGDIAPARARGRDSHTSRRPFSFSALTFQTRACTTLPSRRRTS